MSKPLKTMAQAEKVAPRVSSSNGAVRLEGSSEHFQTRTAVVSFVSPFPSNPHFFELSGTLRHKLQFALGLRGSLSCAIAKHALKDRDAAPNRVAAFL